MCIRDRGISMKKVIHPSLLLAPNAALNIVCAKWQLPEESPALKKCMQLMIEVVIAMGGFGLSAPQVNIPKQVFLLTNPKLMMSDPAQSFNFFINPQLIDASHKKCSYWETCLSLQEYCLCEKIVNCIWCKGLKKCQWNTATNLALCIG
eukprot:TRINITY_DN14332_c0_g1_i1.p1 TRINITY_DN14332_c0_g1~~TRINITY_DN14332_c0_g1_i1.p1  ORF type:complete len:149 (-),score=6.51 TRINITY_DN14332_c0_g1_i1:230-676(-)